MKQCKSCGKKCYNGEKYCPICHYYLGNLEEQSNYVELNKPVTKPLIECPYCHSTNITKVGVVGRTISLALFGLASDKIGKTHKCNNCGSTW